MRIAAVLLTAALAGFVGCGEDGDSAAPQVKEQFDAHTESRRAHIERKVHDGALPPIALELVKVDGAMNIDFIDGPEFANDVVRTSADGKTGKKLQWDLNQNGRIDRAERTITEQELYAATTH